jgi:uncharacterized protein (DUF488 family)
MGYTHMVELGGLYAIHSKPNQGWHNASFRGFADYMQTPAFDQALEKLNQLIKAYSHVFIMCAEAVPWRCHCSLILDAEVVRHQSVLHNIISKTSLQAHQLTSFSIVDRTPILSRFVILLNVRASHIKLN